MKEIALEQVKEPQRYLDAKPLSREELQKAFDEAKGKISKFMYDFTDKFPGSASVNNVYEQVDNIFWTSSFYTGMLWLCYEMTGDKSFREVAEAEVESFKERLKDEQANATHDLGFLYSLSCVADYKLTGNEAAKDAALTAADQLIARYKPIGQFIQAWGPNSNAPETYRLIIDCLMNLPLLYWASETTGDKKYYDAAYNHLNTVLDNVIRPDASTFHTFYFDPETGEPVKGTTHQGFSDDSCWSRGQAWGIYGMAFSYLYTKDERLIEVYKKLTNYFLNRLPEDYIAYWDLIFTDGDQPRDSSAASTAVCGMLEMDKYLSDDDPDKALYRAAIERMMRSLIENYTTKDIPESNGLLLHGVYNLPSGMGIDECTSWGDYYYMEALVRMMKPDWKLYW